MNEIETNIKLKPCPFCGGEAGMFYYGSNGRIIKCKKCFIQKRQKVLRKSVEWLENELIKDWNNRVK